jgi:glycosyltransferase involved in cell wall biosynthesis
VIPAWNEEALLPRLLDSVRVARDRCARGSDSVEVVVADNGSTDATARVAAAAGCAVVPVARRVIAAARNAGAAAARGEVLAFVDADTRIHPDTFDAIDRAVESSGFVGGATGVTLERWSAGLAATYAAMLPMVWLTGMDTGVVFCRRGDFERVGGYDESRLLAEDVAFLMALRRIGKLHGRRLVRLRAVKAVASTRKFDRHGDWHYFTKVLPWAARTLVAPGSVDALARKYWYEDR